MIRRNYSLLTLLSVAAISSSHGATLVDDNFTNSVGTSVDVLADTEATGVGSYENVLTSGGLSSTTVSGFGDGNVFSLGGSIYRGFNGGSTLTLNSLAVNETLSLSFDILYGSDAAIATAGDWGFGFVRNQGTDAADRDSIAYVNANLFDAVDSEVASSEFSYRDGSVYLSSNGADLATFEHPFVDAADGVPGGYNYEFTITKTATETFELAYYIDSVEVASMVTSSLSTDDTEITGIAFRHGSGGGTTYLDNVSVQVIPEPASAGLIVGLGALGSMLCLRRRVSK